MENEELELFFGSQQQQQQQQLCPNGGVWAENDNEWGRLMVEHYKKNIHVISSGNNNNNNNTMAIPRILHFIWLGSTRPLPVAMIESWQHYHHHDKDWQVRIWRDDNILSNLYNQESFQYAIRNRHYGMASDILRLEILYRYGGVYVDVDYLCLSCFNDLMHLDFYCGASHTGCVEVNNGLFGCRANHFVLKCMMNDIATWWFQQKGRLLLLSLVSSFLGDVHDHDNDDTTTSRLTNMDICRHTGPGLWTTVLGRLLVENKLPETCIVVPHHIFHPMPNADRHRELTQEQIIDEYSTEKTKAIHLWHCSWQ